MRINVQGMSERYLHRTFHEKVVSSIQNAVDGGFIFSSSDILGTQDK